MTHQFKFGDVVRFTLINPTETVEAIYLHEYVTDASVAVLVTSKGFNINMPKVRLQLIPHPDTVRLDWLAKNDCALTDRLCDEDGDLLDTPFALIQKQEEHFEVLAAACDIRQAIDAAMREKAA